MQTQTRRSFIKALGGVAVSGGVGAVALAPATAAAAPLVETVVSRRGGYRSEMGRPEGWSVLGPRFPSLLYPVELVSLASKPVGVGQHWLTPDLEGIGRDGALVTALIYDMRREREFDPEALPLEQGVRAGALGRGEIESGPGFRTLYGAWRNNRIGLQVMGWVGPDGDEASALAAIDTLTVGVD